MFNYWENATVTGNQWKKAYCWKKRDVYGKYYFACKSGLNILLIMNFLLSEDNEMILGANLYKVCNKVSDFYGLPSVKPLF